MLSARKSLHPPHQLAPLVHLYRKKQQGRSQIVCILREKYATGAFHHQTRKEVKSKSPPKIPSQKSSVPFCMLPPERRSLQSKDERKKRMPIQEGRIDPQATPSTPPRNRRTRPISRPSFSLSTARSSPSMTSSTCCSGTPEQRDTTRRYLTSTSLLRPFSVPTALRVMSVRILKACVLARNKAALGRFASSTVCAASSVSQALLLGSMGPWVCSKRSRRFCSSSLPRDRL